MKFNNYVTAFELDKAADRISKTVTANEFYQGLIENATRGTMHAAHMYLMEKFWHDQIRPYYKVWPAVHDALLKVPLDITTQSAEIPHQTFAVRLQVGREPLMPDAKGVMLSIGSLLISSVRTENTRTNAVLISTQEVYQAPAPGVFGPFFFSVNDHNTFESEINRMAKEWTTKETEGLESAVRLAVGVLLMAKDPKIVTADVLSKDRRKYEETNDPKYIERARKRGIVGWSIGEKYESCPHIRRPHFAIRHTGKGGTIPRIVPISGSIVHNKRLTTVPTGYITPDGVEVEPTNQ